MKKKLLFIDIASNDRIASSILLLFYILYTSCSLTVTRFCTENYRRNVLSYVRKKVRHPNAIRFVEA